MEAPGAERVKLKHDKLLSNVHFKFNLRRYTMVPPYTPDEGHHGTCAAIEYAVTALKVPLLLVLGRGLHSFPFQLNLSSSVHRITQLKS